MSPGTTSSVNNVCKRCNKNVVSALKCEICHNLYHVSCAKLTNNVKFVNDTKIICCEETLCQNDSDGIFFDAKEMLVNVDNKVDLQLFNYIIRQKDIIIQELRDKITLLNNHIDILNKYQIFNEGEQKPNSNSKISTIAETKKVSNKNERKSNSMTKDVGNPVTVNKQNPINVNNQQNSNIISRENLSSGIMQAQSQLKLQECINLSSDITTHSSQLLNTPVSSQKKEQWSEVVKKKRKRSLVVGNNTVNMSVKGVPKTIDLHVYRVDTQTTVTELAAFLRPNFPEVICESLESRYPDLYTSYKVTIFEEHFKKAMDPQFWPKGACVQRFLVMRKKKMEEKE